MKFEIIESIEHLLEKREKWNELWSRSHCDDPQGRAEPIATWVRHLSQPARFRAVVVTNSDGWLAALPVLLERRGPIRAVTLLRSNLTHGGDLLWDSTSIRRDVAESLIDGLRSIGATLAWFDELSGNSPEWQELMAALEGRGYEHELRVRHGVGMVHVTECWDWYESQLSKNHRKNQRKALSKLSQQGTLSFSESHSVDEATRRKWLEQFIEIEHDNWKGEQGTSLKTCERDRLYYQSLFEDLLASGHLELLQLTLDGEPIAAEFGYHGKGTYFSNKVGYRESFSEFSPGHLLMYLQLQHYHEQGHRLKLNSISPITQLMTRWANAIELRHRLTASLSKLPGNPLTKAITLALHSIRRVKKSAPWEAPELPAAGSLARARKPDPQRLAF